MPAKKSVARKPRKKAREAGAAEKPAHCDDYRITLLTPQGPVTEIAGGSRVRQLAMKWTYVLRNRARWGRSQGTIASIELDAQQAFRELGVNENQIRQLAGAGLIQVTIPYRDTDYCWEGRVMPWEFLITSATRPFRRASITVVRHLMMEAAAKPHKFTEPKSVLFVQSDPGELKGLFTFENERRLVSSSLAIPELPALIRPTIQELRAELESFKPDVIHLSGFDLHQGCQILNISEPAEVESRFDGYFMAGGNESATPHTAEEFAQHLLEGATHHPKLISCNFANSAARMASLLVAYGAGAAIGFQDSVEDDVAERFFAHFYHAWKNLSWDLREAFEEAVASALKGSGHKRGTGIVLWSSASLVEVAKKSTPADRQSLKEAADRELTSETCHPQKDLIVTATPNRTVNYALLHNGGGLFREFKIAKSQPGVLRGLEVEVVLYAGTDTFPCKLVLTLDSESIDLRDRIQVPLTSALARSLRESVHTSLFYRVSWEKVDVVCNTERVTLLPIDEWRFDDDYIWLPSFVLPRDRAVQNVLTDSRPYLMALKDDFGAGFDGYQSVVRARNGAVEDCSGVDDQVKSIWCGLSYARSVGYINPPPSFELYSQRIRTPCEILESSRGTCIDLALLLAACLEYIDVYPVIFLMNGHAFPGYWTSEEAYEKFGRVDEAPASREASRPIGTNGRSWIISRDGHGGVLRWIDEGSLVPVETTFLTQHDSFNEAVRAGRENLRRKREFVALIDIHEARAQMVTPLPVSEIRA